MSEAAHDLFVSYAHEDAKMRDLLVAELGLWGFKVWTDEELEVGRPFNESIAHSIYGARAVVLLSTGHARQSDYIDAEMSFAHALGKPVCEVSVNGSYREELKDIQRVNFELDGDWRDVVHQLTPTLKRAIGPSKIFVAHELVPTPKFCRHCGQPTRVGADFCRSCGQRLHSADSSVPPNSEEKDFVDWVAAEMKGHRLDIWYEHEQSLIFQNRAAVINDAIDRAGVILAVVSETAVTSERFCRHIKRGLEQSDEILPIVYRTGSTSSKELVAVWKETLESVISGDQLERTILDRFDAVAEIDIPEFVDKDSKLMSEVAHWVRDNQNRFRINEQLESEVQRRFKNFVSVVRERNLDWVEVLNLPDFKTGEYDVAAPEQTSTPGMTPTTRIQPREDH